jgi:hypothetical protein
MKFKSDIEVRAGLKDGDNDIGTQGQLLSSTGTVTNWIDQEDIVIGEADKAKSVTLRVKNSTNFAMTKGQVICEAVSATPPSGNLIEVALADNNGTNQMPALGILNEDLDASGGNNDEGDAIMFGKVSGINTSAFEVGDEVFVSDVPGGLTATKPTGIKYIQKVGVVIRDDNTNGTIEVFGAGRVNDVPTPLYVDHANQRLGIGEINPDVRLHVDGGGGILVNNGGGDTVLSANSNSGIFSIGDTGGLGDGVYATNTGTSYFDIYSDSSVKFRMDSNGNVGIGTGTSSLQVKLAVAGATHVGEYFEVSDGLGGDRTLAIDAPSGTFRIGDIDGITDEAHIEGDGENIKIFNGGSLTLITDSNQNVGIGAPVPSQKLHVNGNARLTGLFYDGTNSGGTAGQILSSDGGQTEWIDGSAIPGVPAGSGTTNYLARWTPNASTLGTGVTYDNGTNVGIGTNDPKTKLHVLSTVGSLPALGAAPSAAQIGGSAFGTLFSTLTSGKGVIQQGRNDGTPQAYDLSLQPSGGNVGVGTDDPNRLLTVETASSGCYLALNSSSNNTTIGSDVNGCFIVYDDSSSTYRMVIDQTTGNVGIGTPSPNAKLEVDGSVRVTGGGIDVGYGNNGTNYLQVGYGRTTNGYAVLDLIGDATYTDYGFRILRNNTGPNTDTDILHRGTGDLDLKTIEAGDIGFWTTSSQRMIVKSDGDVGIGTTDPQAKLEIAGHSSNGKFLLIDNVGGGETFLNVEDGVGSQLLQIKRETGNTISFNSYNDFNFIKNVGIKQTDPAHALDVTGTGRFTGTVTATNFILSSDETLKDNIKEIDTKHVDVDWKNFELKSEPGVKRAGVIAQELEIKHPEFVRTADDGLKSVAYIDLLITKIAELEARLEKLEK